MPTRPPPQVGEDVTDLMPAIGEDVTDLVDQGKKIPNGAGDPAPTGRTWQSMPLEAVKSFGRLVRQNPAVVGGMAGAAVGGPLGLIPAAALATLGGAGGAGYGIVDEALTQGKVSPSAGEDWNRMATSGGIQGASELAGGAIGKGLTKGAPLVYHGLLKPSKGLQREFGNISETAVREGIPITQGGLRKTDAALTASTGKVEKMIADAQAAGVPPVNPAEVIQAWKPTIDTLRQRQKIGQVSQIPQALKRARRLVTEMGPGVPVVEAQGLKRVAQNSADVARRMEERGVKAQGADAMLDKATAQGLQHALEARIKELGPQNKISRDLLGILEAVQDSTARSPLTIGGARDVIAAGGGMAAGFGTGDPTTGFTVMGLLRAMSMPSVGSHAAIRGAQVGRHMPKVVQGGRGLAAMLSSHDEE